MIVEDQHASADLSNAAATTRLGMLGWGEGGWWGDLGFGNFVDLVNFVDFGNFGNFVDFGWRWV